VDPVSDTAPQLRLLRDIVALAGTDDRVAQVWILGSARRPESLDRWSDVDLGLVLTERPPLESLLPPDAVVWALDRNGDDVRSACRVVLTDGRRVDLVVAAAAEFERADGVPAHDGGPRSATSRGRLIVPDPPDAAVNEARFVAVQAAVKFGRGDRLIGSHLTLELAQLCLVQAMLLRDRDERTTSHRFGTARDDLADSTWSILGSGEHNPHLRLRRLTEHFDGLHTELDPRYVPDWSGLAALVD
jgi:hypothetical protein